MDIKDFRFHDLRHTWASWHVMHGTSLQQLMELGGWESYEMVLRYAHLAPEHLADAGSRIEQPSESVEPNSTISLRQKRERPTPRCKPLRTMARPERFELSTAWFVARAGALTVFINQSLAVLAYPIPQLSYQSLTVHCHWKLAQYQHSHFAHRKRSIAACIGIRQGPIAFATYRPCTLDGAPRQCGR